MPAGRSNAVAARRAPMASSWPRSPPTPMFGYKSHIGIDQRHGFIRTWSASDAARYDGRELTGLIDPANTGSSIWADTAYRSHKNERAILRAGRVSKIHFRRSPGSRCRPSVSAPMPRAPKSVPPSSTCSLHRNTGWASLSAPSASNGPRPKSASPTSPSTSNASSTGKPGRRRRDQPPKERRGRPSWSSSHRRPGYFHRPPLPRSRSRSEPWVNQGIQLEALS